MRRLFKLAAGAAALGLCLGTSPAAAQERSAMKPGFAFPAGGQTRILLFRPWIKVGAQSTAGMFEPDADWTQAAKGNIGAALSEAQRQLGRKVVAVGEPVGPDGALLADYRALFSTVAQAVITYQFFVGNRLPTKKRKGEFDWTLGPGVSTLKGADKADYALFINTEDQYGSAGRKVFQVLAAMGGVGITAGVHKGFAGLIDLKTGDLVWLNADLRMGGDVRTPDGAEKRVSELLAGFPGTAMTQSAASGGSKAPPASFANGAAATTTADLPRWSPR